ETKDRFATVYGRIEVSAKLPGTQGIWPAHWMLPDSREWPPEIDIMELLGHQPTRVHMTHHWGVWPNVQSHTGSFDGSDFTAGFHEFAIEWSPDRIDWFVDGALRFSSTNTIPTEPFYVILNTAVGGDWPGAPNGSTVFPQLHEIDYVRVYVPADPGPALQDIVDTTATGATTDGVIDAAEYAGGANGINNGLLDRIGANSTMRVDSDAQGELQFSFDSATAWSNDAFATVIYIDAIEGQGFASTYSLNDTSAAPQRAASGKGNSGQRSDLYFAPGFRADFALVLQYGAARLFALGEDAHTLLNGADLGAPTDLLGGDDMRYVVDDGSTGGRVREVSLLLTQLGLQPGDAFRFVATVTHVHNAFRANEFVGVAPGNDFDAGNPGASTVVLKPGDFLRFTSVDACVGDIDGSGSVDLADLAGLLAAFGATQGGPGYVAAADLNNDGSIDLSDLAGMLAVFGDSCS
ncbi:MAG: family 16 glycosylhydrolase, partial [Phycisphaerales bacterium]|nr:family 16 glycosylhydrolase [Phycisphaerales bacterium]